MPTSRGIWAGSSLVLLLAFAGGLGVDAACSPSDTTDAGDGGLVCDPDSGDPAGCPCDPGTTKTADCYTGPPGTNSKGICQTGKRSCTPQGTYTACEGEVTPKPEVCNLADDDCNGFTDDLPELTDAAVIATCTSPACDPNFSDAAITCWGPDPGICGAGRKVCTGTPKGGQPTGCEEFIHTPAAEVCNGIDDDCNGIVDDGLDNLGACDVKWGTKWAPDANPFDGGQPTQILGECIHGQLHCAGNPDGGTACGPSQPGTEVQQYGYGCDGLDNDCNGKFDDHACSDQYDKQLGNDYCCTDGYFFNCAPASEVDAGYYTSCTLAN
jgi:hypothetical protein